MTKGTKTMATKKATKKAAKRQLKRRAVLVCTEFRGVFFGYARDTSGDTIVLENCRNAIYWSSDVGGFAGLADGGPTAGCRIGAPVTAELRKITCVAEVTPAAEDRWLKAPVHRG